MMIALPNPSGDFTCTLFMPFEGENSFANLKTEEQVTAFFKDWYDAPCDLDPAAHALTNVPDWWKQLTTPSTTTPNPDLCDSSKIPPLLQLGLRRVCNIKASADVQREIQERIDDIITFDEFTDAINTLRAGSAPGPSETTPNMLRAWNPAIRHFIYKHMLDVWRDKSYPTWFKDKVIKLAPKVSSSNNLSHMRPINKLIRSAK